MKQLNLDILKDSTLTLDQIFEYYKESYPSIDSWATILENRDGFISAGTLAKLAIKSLKVYDKSSNINTFIYKGKDYWIELETRKSLDRLIDSGATEITLQLNEETYITVSAEKLQAFLNQLEIYAGKCFTVTANHLQNIKKLYSVEDLRAYDYTANYPDKIELNED